MPKPIQLFLQWEIRMKLDYLHEPINRFTANTDAYSAAIAAQLPITVNQFRRDLGLNPHPDERGEMFVWQENIDKAGDNTIPDGLLNLLWMQLLDQESKKLEGGKTVEQLAALYPELYAEVSK